MKTGIHPKWNDKAQVKCICGHSFVVGSTQDLIEVSSCYKCHPFYTGEQRFVDTEGRVEKFQKKQQAAKIKQEKIKEKKKKQEVRETQRPKTLREMLLG